jgi:transcription initiation factor TFIIIB Brf1 subunit/transcription initiation factor TFIIB
MKIIITTEEEIKSIFIETETASTLKNTEKSKSFTTARQVLAVHYLLKYANVKNIDRTEIARFIQFLTGKNFDNIYKKLQSPFKLNDKYLKEDLRYVKDYFERLGMQEIVKMINNEISA